MKSENLILALDYVASVRSNALNLLSRAVGQYSRSHMRRETWLDLQAVNEVLEDRKLRALFGAALLTANEGGWTIRELASQLGISKSALHRFMQKGKSWRDKKPKIPKVEVTVPPSAATECNHRRLYSDKRKRVCLRCLLSNFEGSPELQRHVNFDPVPEDAPLPKRKFQPRTRKKKAK